MIIKVSNVKRDPQRYVGYVLNMSRNGIAYLLQIFGNLSERKTEKDGLTDKIDIPGIREIPGDVATRDPRIAGRNTVTRTLRNLEFMIQECNGSGMMRDRFGKSCRECSDSGSQKFQVVRTTVRLAMIRSVSCGLRVTRKSFRFTYHIHNSSATLQQIRFTRTNE